MSRFCGVQLESRVFGIAVMLIFGRSMYYLK